MRISDWSSDVCSSDLRGEVQGARRTRRAARPPCQYSSGEAEYLQVRRPGDAGRQPCDRMPVHRDDRRPAGRLSRSRSEEHTSELQSLMRISYAVFCLKKKTKITIIH